MKLHNLLLLGTAKGMPPQSSGVSRKKMTKLDIKPGIGIGPAILGFTRDETIEQVGQPDSIDKYEYRNGEIDETWHYFEGNLSITFGSDDQYRAYMITAKSTEAKLNGKVIVGIAEDGLNDHISQLGYGTVVLENDFEESGRDYICDHWCPVKN